jgi:hypothetical protein
VDADELCAEVRIAVDAIAELQRQLAERYAQRDEVIWRLRTVEHLPVRAIAEAAGLAEMTIYKIVDAWGARSYGSGLAEVEYAEALAE